jgi:hypothetical protein
VRCYADPCRENPCFASVDCIPRNMTSYECGPCPRGYVGQPISHIWFSWALNNNRKVLYSFPFFNFLFASFALWIFCFPVKAIRIKILFSLPLYILFSPKFVARSKETGHLWPYYIYMTVFIRNAANLAHILPKASRTTFTPEVFL